MKYSWNKQKLLKLLQSDEKEIKSNDTMALQAEINSLRCALNMPVLKKIHINNYNVESEATHLSAMYIFKIKSKHKIKPEINKKLTTKEIVSSALDTLEHSEKRFISHMIKSGKLNLSHDVDVPYTYYLPYHHDSLIAVSDRGILSDARNIAHEVAHAMQSKNLEYKELENKRLSYLRETLPVLNEMLFIDRLNSYEDIVNEQNIFLNNYYDAYIRNIRDCSDVYAQSFALAEYLFMLSKTEKGKYKEYISMYREMAKSNTDSAIIDAMEIDSVDMIRANEKYLNLYRK